MVELHSCNRNCTACKAENTSIWPFTENVCWPLIYTMGQKPELCKLGPPSEGLQWNPSGISVSQSNNSCSRQVMFHSCSFRYILVRCNNHENWPVSTWLHAGENPAKSESTKQAQRKWNKLEIRCFLFVRFKWELCFLANSQCGQVTIFAGIFFFPSLSTCANAGPCFVPHLLQQLPPKA